MCSATRLPHTAALLLTGEHHHARRDLHPDRCRLPGRLRALRIRLRSFVRATAMSIDYVLGSIVTIGLLVYLVYALIRPEKF
jgi:K+-transporting ATPase KdpF subunit